MEPVAQLDGILAVARAHGTTRAAEFYGVFVRTVQRLDGYDRGRGHPSAAEVALYAPRSTCFCPMCREWKATRGLPAPSRQDLLDEVVRIASVRPRVLITAVAHRMGVTRPTAAQLVLEARRQGLITNVRGAA